MQQLIDRDDWNLMELTVLAEPAKLSTCELQTFGVHLEKETWSNWMQKVCQFKGVRNPKSYELREYYQMELLDQYDSRDDTHRILQKQYVHDTLLTPTIHLAIYQQDLLPEYRFPNVKDLAAIATRHRTWISHTNRIGVAFDETYWDFDTETPMYTVTVQVSMNEKVDREVLKGNLQDLLRLFK